MCTRDRSEPDTQTTASGSEDGGFIKSIYKDVTVDNTFGAVTPVSYTHLKDFLKFMARDDMLKLYTEKTGSPRPFTYDIASITGLSDFSNNILDLWSKANKVYMYSESPIYFMKYYYWPAAGTPYSRIQIGDETAADVYKRQPPRFPSDDSVPYPCISPHDAPPHTPDKIHGSPL